MFKSYLRTSFRNLFRHRPYALVNILGLSVGMAACILVALFLQHEFRYDAWHENVDRIYRVMRLRHPQGGDHSYYAPGTQDAAGHALAAELPEVEAITRFVTRSMWAGLEDRGYDVRGAMADPNFLSFFTFPLIEGPRPSELAHGSVYITESFAQRLYGTANVVGRRLKVYYKWVDGDFIVAGVLRDQPAATSGELKFDLLINHEGTSGPQRSPWNQPEWSPTSSFLVIRTFIRLAPGASLPQLRSKLEDFARRHLGDGADPRDTYDVMPLRRQRLYARRDFNLKMDQSDQQAGFAQGDINRCYTFSFVAAIVLVLACVNFVNLSTARGANRSIEVGVRKALGSTRSQLVVQFLSETVLLAALSGVLAIAIADLALTAYNSVAFSSLRLNGWSAVFALLLTLVVGLSAGAYPALFLSSFVAANVLKGSGRRTAGRSRLRRGLVLFQFAVSIALVIGTLVAARQTNYIRTRNLGFAKEGVITIPLLKENFDLRPRHEAIRNRFEAGTDVLSASVSLFPPGGENEVDRVTISRPGIVDSVNVYYLPVDHKFTEVYEIPILDGRPLALTDKGQFNVLLNETAALSLGGVLPGTVLRFWGRDFTVVGIIKDFHHSSLHNPVRPLMLEYVWPSFNFVNVKVRTDNLPDVLRFLETLWREFAPGRAFKYQFVDEYLDNLYHDEMRTQEAVAYLSGISLFVACLGLLGLAAYTTELRTKEVGVRKVLGASVSSVLGLLLKEFVVLMAAASLLAWPAAFLVTRAWLDRFAYRIELGPGVFVAGSMLVLCVALSTIIFQSVRAARANPVDALRYE